MAIDAAGAIWFDDLIAETAGATRNRASGVTSHADTASDAEVARSSRSRAPIDPALAASLSRWVIAALTGGSKPPLPAALTADRAARIAFIAVSDGERSANVVMGRGRGIVAAVADAARILGRRGPLADPPRGLVLDVVASVEPVPPMRWDQPVAIAGAERGLFGLAFQRGSGLAFGPIELVVHGLIDRNGELSRDRVAARARRRGLAGDARLFVGDPSLAGFRFTTDSFFYDGDAAQALYRGHLREQPVTATRLRRAVAAGAGYLARAVRADGSFVYSYRADRDRPRDRYNMVRHAGTVFSMLQAWRLVPGSELRHRTERALTHLVGHVERFPASTGNAPDRLAVAHGGKIKLGGVALAALALATHAEVTGQSRHVATAQGLCRYIVGEQRPDGSFLHQRTHPGGEPRDFVSQYYPGEALLALTAMHRVDRDPRWLDAAEAGARFLIGVRDRGVPTLELTHDHWLLCALDRLYRQRPRALYLDHAMRIAEAILAAQRHQAAMPDHAGSYSDAPRSTPVATRSEGLLAAYTLARDFGRPRMARTIADAVRLAARVQLATQIDAARAAHLADPPTALGGFTRSYDDFEVRIDYVQHNLSALIGLIDLLERSTGRSGDASGRSGDESGRSGNESGRSGNEEVRASPGSTP